MSCEQREIWYRGHVQGVGFRFTTQAVARGFHVSGTVGNLADGRVHLVVEGEKRELDLFLSAIDERLGQFVRSSHQECRPATGQFGGFEIRH